MDGRAEKEQEQQRVEWEKSRGLKGRSQGVRASENSAYGKVVFYL